MSNNVPPPLSLPRSQVLTDPTTAEKATMFIKDVSTREDIKAAIVALLTLVLEDPASVNKARAPWL